MDKFKPQISGKSVFKSTFTVFNLSIFSACLAILTACGGGGGDGGGDSPVTLKASVSGLTSPGLVLQDKGEDDLVINTDGTYSFKKPIAIKDHYAVTVKTQPAGQLCTVNNGTGAGITSSVPVVKVVCSVNTYTIAGVVTALNPGSKVTLTNNSADPLVVSANGEFKFATPVAHNGSYAVRVDKQPDGQICTVSNNAGDGVVQNISNVAVMCSMVRHSIAGTVTGLNPGNHLTLYNNSADPLTVGADGKFTFATPVAHNSSYTVTVGAQPPGQVCTVSKNKGTGIVQDINDVTVACSILHYTISGSVVGLQPGQQVTLHNNETDPLIVAADGKFTFATPVAYNGSYAVTIGTTQFLQGCQVVDGIGSGVSANITSVKVSCNGPVATILQTFNGTNGVGKDIYAGLVQGSDGILYGTTLTGGAHNQGTIYSLTPQGVLKLLYSFTGAADGRLPYAGLTFGSDGNLYGTTAGGGVNDLGTVFKVTPEGKLTTLSSLSTLGSSNTYPSTQLILAKDGNFYGMTPYGGVQNTGTVFKMTPQGTVTTVYSFGTYGSGTYPYGKLVQDSVTSNFYGVTAYGGANGQGTVFALMPGGELTTLYTFNGSNKGGTVPFSGLTKGSDGHFYGTTSSGGAHGAGTIFKISPEGEFTPLYSLNPATDGSHPYGELTLASDGNLYGTTTAGGAGNTGTIFKFNSQGVFTLVYTFDSTNKGQSLTGLTAGRDGNLYGTKANLSEWNIVTTGTAFKFGPD